MPVNPDNVDLQHIEGVTDIEPAPTLAVGEHEHYYGPLGDEGRGYLKELIDAVAEDAPYDVDPGEPVGGRALDRIGVPYEHRQWRGYDLYWAQVEDDEVVDALRTWHQAHVMGS